VLFEVNAGEGNGSPAVDLALGREDWFDERAEYGELLPYSGCSRPEELLRLYCGWSFKTKSSGTWRSTCEVILGETAGTLLMILSVSFDRAEEDLGRELVIVVARTSSYIQTRWCLCEGSLPCSLRSADSLSVRLDGVRDRRLSQMHSIRYGVACPWKRRLYRGGRRAKRNGIAIRYEGSRSCCGGRKILFGRADRAGDWLVWKS
jgi:hypothetical protein